MISGPVNSQTTREESETGEWRATWQERGSKRLSGRDVNKGLFAPDRNSIRTEQSHPRLMNSESEGLFVEREVP